MQFKGPLALETQELGNIIIPFLETQSIHRFEFGARTLRVRYVEMHMPAFVILREDRLPVKGKPGSSLPGTECSWTCRVPISVSPCED